MIKPYLRRHRLERWMRERRVTGSLMSFNTGICSTRFSRILNGRVEPTIAERQRIADVLDVPATDDVFQADDRK